MSKNQIYAGQLKLNSYGLEVAKICYQPLPIANPAGFEPRFLDFKAHTLATVAVVTIKEALASNQCFQMFFEIIWAIFSITYLKYILYRYSFSINSLF